MSIAWAYAALPVGSAFAIIGILGKLADQLVNRELPAAEESVPEADL